MVERIEDLTLPLAVVTRLIKAALPDGASVSKEARCAITAATSVFVIFLTSTATTVARKQNHKTITAENILEALKDMEFESFVDPLSKDLEEYRKAVKDKKETKAKNAAAVAAQSNEAASGEANDEEENKD